MRKLTYLAVLEETKDGFGVYFPDLPGCASFGDSIEDAAAKATEALELHIYGMEKDNDEIPMPNLRIKNIEGIVIPISIFPDIVKNEMSCKRVKTNVTIPLWLKEKAEVKGINFSKVLEVTLLEIINK